MFIYKISNTRNDKVYIGQTTLSAQKRFLEHSRSNSLIGNAMRKHGIDCFSVEIIDVASSQLELDHKERYYISQLNSQTPNGYNIKTGGSAGKHHELTKIKLSDSRPFLVYSKDGSFIGEWDNSRKCSESLKCNYSKIRACLSGKRKSTGGLVFVFKNKQNEIDTLLTIANTHSKLGTKHTEQTKSQMKKNHASKSSGYINPNKGKKITHSSHKNWKKFTVYSVVDNSIVGTWMSQSQCARDLGLHQGNIGSCLRGVKNGTNGYIFKYGALNGE